MIKCIGIDKCTLVITTYVVGNYQHFCKFWRRLVRKSRKTHVLRDLLTKRRQKLQKYGCLPTTNTLSIRSEGDELTCGNLQYSILVMFLAFSAKVVLVTLLAHLIFNTQQKVASMHPSKAHCATFSIKKVPKKYWLVLVLTIFQKKISKVLLPKNRL